MTATLEERGLRKSRQGLVVSTSMDKTIVVEVARRVRHLLYGKVMRKTKRYMVHDEKNVAAVGDSVTIMETRPLSRHKHWRLVEITKKAR